MNRNCKPDLHLSPLIFTFHDYAISPILQQKLDELANIHHKKRLFPPTAKAKSIVAATVSQLRIAVRRRLSAAFYAVKQHAVTDLRSVPVGKLIALTHCDHCGVSGLSLLTSSTKRRLSPSFREKVRMLLPKERESATKTQQNRRELGSGVGEDRIQPGKSGEVQRRRGMAVKVFGAAERMKRVIKPRMQHAFEALYLGKGGQFGKDQSLTFEFVSDEIEAGEEHVEGEKIYNISRIEQQSCMKMQEESFASEDHILNTIDSDSDPLLTASYSAATILLFSRLEKVVSRRASLFFSKLSPP